METIQRNRPLLLLSALTVLATACGDEPKSAPDGGAEPDSGAPLPDGGGEFFEYEVIAGECELLWQARGEDGASLAHSLLGDLDVNGDGAEDVIVGGGLDDADFFQVRRAADGVLVDTLEFPFAGRQSIPVTGDFDGADGLDLIVQTYVTPPSGDADGGVIVGELGHYELRAVTASGEVIWHRAAPVDEPYFGQVVQAIEDVNDDGQSDLLVSSETNEQGAVYVVSGASGATLNELPRPADALFWYGNGLGRADVTGDGVGDWVIGDPSWAAPGSAFPGDGRISVYSGADNALAWHATAQVGSFFGEKVMALGDLDGDGRAEVATVAPMHDGTTPGNSRPVAGTLAVLRGSDGTKLWERPGRRELEELGRGLARTGDINGDGAGDFLAGAPGSHSTLGLSGRFAVVSGADGAVIADVEEVLPSLESPNSGFGAAVAAADGEDGPILIVAAPWANLVTAWSCQ